MDLTASFYSSRGAARSLLRAPLCVAHGSDEIGRTSMPAIVKQDICKSNADCIDACPTEAIQIVDGKAVVDADECTDCHACVDACLEDAIEIE